MMEGVHLGVMQGRLLSDQCGRIQSFPAVGWETEFLLAQTLSLECIELTVDAFSFSENPLSSDAKRQWLWDVSYETGVHISSVTCDFVMEIYSDFKKKHHKKLADIFSCLAEFSRFKGSQLTVVIPLVDSTSLSNNWDKKKFNLFIKQLASFQQDYAGFLSFCFETDEKWEQSKNFLAEFFMDPKLNFDLGNYCSYGMDGMADIQEHVEDIVNVHIKDRLINGPTVPLLSGDTPVRAWTQALLKTGYKGNLIFQTARRPNSSPVESVRQDIGSLKTCIL